jgi:hypothetical protein
VAMECYEGDEVICIEQSIVLMVSTAVLLVVRKVKGIVADIDTCRSGFQSALLRQTVAPLGQITNHSCIAKASLHARLRLTT